MTLSEAGNSRIRGYLYVLERSLSVATSAALAADAVREVESHIRDRVADSQGLPNERDALEAILRRFGGPATVARAYSLEMIMEEAAVGGRTVAVLRSVFHAASTGVTRFLAALVLFAGYAIGAGFVVTAALKPIFPDNVGCTKAFRSAQSSGCRPVSRRSAAIGSFRSVCFSVSPSSS